MAGSLGVFVVIPAFRVAGQIAGVLGAIPSFIQGVIVVDDASPDDTGNAARSVADPRIQVLRHELNQGVGGAMATGFRAALAAGARIVVKCDGDGQMDPEDIPLLIRPLIEKRAEYAKGCRFHHFQELRSMPRVRLFGNVALTFLTKLASGYWQILDPQNGFIAIEAETLRRIPIEQIAKGYFFENDMLIRLNSIEARVADVPLPARYADETSSLSPGRILFDFPARLVAGFVRRIFFRYLFYDVSPVALFLVSGFLLFSFGFLFGAYHWIDGAIRNQPTPTGTVIVAALPVILGFQLMLQAIVLDVQNSPRARSPRALEAEDDL